MTNESIGLALKEVRQDRHKSQAEVVRLLGLTKAAVSKFENGHRKVTALELVRLLRIYRISYDDFLKYLYRDRSYADYLTYQ